MNGKHLRWSGAEIRILLKHYPEGGAKACIADLPGRSLYSIYAAARYLRIPRTGSHRGRKMVRS